MPDPFDNDITVDADPADVEEQRRSLAGFEDDDAAGAFHTMSERGPEVPEADAFEQAQVIDETDDWR